MKSRRLFLLSWPLVALLIFSSELQIAHARETSVIGGNPGLGSGRLKPSVGTDSQAAPWNQFGAKAGVDYHGEGLAVTSEANGARLHCLFQRLDGEATTGGLWVTSALTNQRSARFQVKAVRLGRPAADWQLAETGTVTVDRQTVRFERAGLAEQYGVNTDGVRQDFIVTGKPAGFGELQVRLAVAGARVEGTDYGAQLVLAHSDARLPTAGCA
jgi:hypothetical protein